MTSRLGQYLAAKWRMLSPVILSQMFKSAWLSRSYMTTSRFDFSETTASIKGVNPANSGWYSPPVFNGRISYDSMHFKFT